MKSKFLFTFSLSVCFLSTSQSGSFAQSVGIREQSRQVDLLVQEQVQKSGQTSRPGIDDYTFCRRVYLDAIGRIPTIDELDSFVVDEQADKRERLIEKLLNSKGYQSHWYNYWADLLRVKYVGDKLHHPGNYGQWIKEALRTNKPYDQMAHELINASGPLYEPGNGATGFYAREPMPLDHLANSVKTFLGLSIECAQCHDHPFRDWKQDQFEGLAAYYGQASLSPFGIEDRPTEYQIRDPETEEDRVVVPCVPFQPELLPEEGSRREKLALWVTHEDNRRFHRAIANRVWGLIFGRPWETPVDDLDDPPETGQPDFLEVLAKDFREHDNSLKRLIEVITSTKAFRVASSLPDDSEQSYQSVESRWAVFPLIRLRPEQVIGSVLQTASIRTIDRNSHFLARLIRFVREEEFVQEYGDLGMDELDARGGTIPQRLLLMNGSLITELMESQPFNSTGRISALASTDKKCVEVAFLSCLTRYPTKAELAEFSTQLKGTSETKREEIISDLFWSLVNSTEYSWNH